MTRREANEERRRAIEELVEGVVEEKWSRFSTEVNGLQSQFNEFSMRLGEIEKKLKMSDDERKTCPFVVDEGCTVYEARPYSCRLYPLDTEQGVEYRFIVGPQTCHGLKESKEWTVETWRRDQGLYAYDDTDHELKDVMRAEEVWEARIQEPKMQDMIYTALYDADRFREFIFKSSFLEKFRIDDDILERIEKDDVALLYFAGQWLRFSLFGKKGFLKIDRDYLERKKKEVLGV